MKIPLTGYDDSRLREWGIQTEGSTHRIHIDLDNKKLIAFATTAGVAALPEDEGSYYYPQNPRVREDPNLLQYSTARGTRVPYGDIEGAEAIEIPKDILNSMPDYGEDTETRGRAGAYVCNEMINRGLYRPAVVVVDTDLPDQLRGDGMGEFVPEYKFDWACFERGVFLQTHEYNPYGQY